MSRKLLTQPWLHSQGRPRGIRPRAPSLGSWPPGRPATAWTLCTCEGWTLQAAMPTLGSTDPKPSRSPRVPGALPWAGLLKARALAGRQTASPPPFHRHRAKTRCGRSLDRSDAAGVERASRAHRGTKRRCRRSLRTRRTGRPDASDQELKTTPVNRSATERRGRNPKEEHGNSDTNHQDGLQTASERPLVDGTRLRARGLRHSGIGAVSGRASVTLFPSSVHTVLATRVTL